MIKENKVIKLKTGGRNESQLILNACKIYDYIKKLDSNKLYGIMTSENVVVLMKKECILVEAVENIIRELNERKLNLEKNLNEENLGDNILVVEELKGIKKQIEILQKLIESED